LSASLRAEAHGSNYKYWPLVCFKHQIDKVCKPISCIYNIILSESCGIEWWMIGVVFKQNLYTVESRSIIETREWRKETMNVGKRLIQILKQTGTDIKEG
jgi:hypothetical protein